MEGVSQSSDHFQVNDSIVTNPTAQKLSSSESTLQTWHSSGCLLNDSSVGILPDGGTIREETVANINLELQNEYQNYKNILQQLAQKIGDIEQETEEHKYVKFEFILNAQYLELPDR